MKLPQKRPIEERPVASLPDDPSAFEAGLTSQQMKRRCHHEAAPVESSVAGDERSSVPEDASSASLSGVHHAAGVCWVKRFLDIV